NQMASVGSLSGTQQSVADGTSGIDATRFAGLAGRAVVNAGVSSAIYGTSFGDALKNSLINDVAAIGANTVGRNTDALTPQNVIYHAMVGAAAAELRGEDPAAGALGAATAALINPLADDYTSATDETTRTAQHAAIATLMAGLVARAAGKDEGTAIGAAQNETFNNFLTQENIEEKYARLAGATSSEEKAAIIREFIGKSTENTNAALDGSESVMNEWQLLEGKARLQALLDHCGANDGCQRDVRNSVAEIDGIIRSAHAGEVMEPYLLGAEAVITVAGGALALAAKYGIRIGGELAVAGVGEAQSLANAARLRAQLAGQEIAGGHAFEMHVLNQGLFKDLGIRTREQFASHIENVVNNPTASRQLSGGRSAYWQESTGTVVIRNPRATDGGTAFQPTNGRAYFDGLR
ncbi:MAG: DUF637 domain-containing protein, partial [Xanthomonadales bacterium]|nr:DUF637 domain-containing protein [Xanthomonadales bacterium]